MDIWVAVIVFAVTLYCVKRWQKGKRKSDVLIKCDDNYDINKRVLPPKKKGKKPEEIEREEREYINKLRIDGQKAFERDKRNALKVGSKKYIWRSAGDEGVCKVCAKNDGKKYSWDSLPPNGHAGTCTKCDIGYCRCLAEPIIQYKLIVGI